MHGLSRVCLKTNNALLRFYVPIVLKIEKQMMMLSDNDIFLVSCKGKQDLFFKKLQYIRNKIPSNNNIPIISHYSDIDQEGNLIKLATESLLAYRTEEEVFNQIMSEQETEEDGIRKYLKFLNQKIVLFLNYQHNIRVKNCDFIYIRSYEGVFYFVNIQKLEFTNLTNAIIQRQKRLAQRQE